MNFFNGWKTFLFNTIATAAVVTDQLVSNGALIASVFPSTAAAVATLGVVNVLLRAITSTPIFKGE